MSYQLLTGATGLLGSYLLRDALRAGRRMAVIARSSRGESAHARIETILARWEQADGRTLPRPVVLEGDLVAENLGLDETALRWVARHCGSVLHNAASLTFHGKDRDGEPWRSNVGGTRRLLELCRHVGIDRFHYISTAYVSGERSGRVLESELDEQQAFCNDYERSKLEAELMVRNADHLDSPTIYRPPVIIGDSQTGYTPTFHGFYVPLKAAHILVNQFVRGDHEKLLLMALGLTGGECKNFVPVDWVSSVITYLHGRPEHHGRTYHITSERRVLVSDVAEVMKRAIRTYSEEPDMLEDRASDVEQFEQLFSEQLGLYGEYWRDDPVFDRTNTAKAAGHLVCPDVNQEMLMRLATFAIRSNFGRPRPRPIKPAFDAHRFLQDRLPMCEGSSTSSHPAEQTGQVWGLQIDGPGGGQWKLFVEKGRILGAEEGLDRGHTAVLRMTAETLQQLVGDRLTAQRAINGGRIHIKGSRREFTSLLAGLQNTAGRAA